VTRLVEQGEAVDPGDIAAAVNSYRACTRSSWARTWP